MLSSVVDFLLLLKQKISNYGMADHWVLTQIRVRPRFIARESRSDPGIARHFLPDRQKIVLESTQLVPQPLVSRQLLRVFE